MSARKSRAYRPSGPRVTERCVRNVEPGDLLVTMHGVQRKVRSVSWTDTNVSLALECPDRGREFLQFDPTDRVRVIDWDAQRDWLKATGKW